VNVWSCFGRPFGLPLCPFPHRGIAQPFSFGDESLRNAARSAVVLDGVGLQEFETCPAWVGNEDERERYVLSVFTTGRLPGSTPSQPRPSWARKVRNVSKVGSQTFQTLTRLFLCGRSALFANCGDFCGDAVSQIRPCPRIDFRQSKEPRLD
jgi:hypothetical protein